jgi:hypothetical protein
MDKTARQQFNKLFEPRFSSYNNGTHGNHYCQIHKELMTRIETDTFSCPLSRQPWFVADIFGKHIERQLEPKAGYQIFGGRGM